MANLRAYNYGIKMTNAKQARLDIGNIIPAISSTNAFFAGSMLYEMFKYFVHTYLLNNELQINDSEVFQLINMETFM